MRVATKARASAVAVGSSDENGTGFSAGKDILSKSSSVVIPGQSGGVGVPSAAKTTDN